MNRIDMHTRIERIFLFVLCMFASSSSLATQPLLDQYTDGMRNGHIFPPSCCYVELPANDRVWDIRRREMQSCSALGGPVGIFKLEAGKLWLTGLFKCGGPVSLQDVFPELAPPVLAAWLTGTFRTTLDLLCHTREGQEVYKVTQELEIVKGVVRSIAETSNDLSSCVK